MPYVDPEKKRKYSREWKAARRAAYFADKSCAKCGSRDGLELDHVDPRVKTSHRIWTWSRARVASELAKCQVLCRDCHMAKTLSTRPRWRHGTSYGYITARCRCQDCARANNEKKKSWRRRRRAAGLSYT